MWARGHSAGNVSAARRVRGSGQVALLGARHARTVHRESEDPPLLQKGLSSRNLRALRGFCFVSFVAGGPARLSQGAAPQDTPVAQNEWSATLHEELHEVIVDNKRFIEPGKRAAKTRSRSEGGTTTLPEDLLREQSIRIQLLYAVGVALWLSNLVLDVYLSPHGDRGPHKFLFETIGAALSAGVALYARCNRCNPRIKANLGVVFMVPHAFLLALLNSWAAQPTTARPVSGITVLILLFGMLAPARPRSMLIAGIVSASMDPLGVWIAHLRGLPTPPVLSTFLMFYPNYACAILAIVPARILYRLGRQIREARALGGYQLVERLGEGGMGEVWRARHRLLARSAAIKLIRADMLSDGSLDKAAVTLGRFEREAQATAALTSPHTIRLFDFGQTADGTFYYVMELLDGRDLASLVREFGPLPPARAMHLLRQVCRSLSEAHARGLIHRDIKPANVYVCRMGLEYDFVKVLDFGLVKQEQLGTVTTQLTAEPIAMGTPAYMAPEAIMGEPVDRRVDVYALGCLAYFLLTGKTVFEADTAMKLLLQHVQDMPVPPSQRTEQLIPCAIDRLIMSCLEKDPARRPRDAQELLQLASSPSIAGEWDHREARQWWETHLPELTVPTPLTAPEWRLGALAEQ
jgi:serine/threonine-protein kinase